MAKKKKVAKRPRNGDSRRAEEFQPYDDSNVKKACGLLVDLHQQRTLMFPDGHRWNWRTVGGRMTLCIMTKKGTVVAHIAQSCVIYVTGPQTLFRDGDAK